MSKGRLSDVTFVVAGVALVFATLAVAGAGGAAGAWLAYKATNSGPASFSLAAVGELTWQEQAALARDVVPVLESSTPFRIEVVVVHAGHVDFNTDQALDRVGKDISWVRQQSGGLVAEPEISLAGTLRAASGNCDDQRTEFDKYLFGLATDNSRLTLGLFTAQDCPWSGLATAAPPMVALTVTPTRQMWLPGVLAHEFAHALGADHAGSYACPGERWDPANPECLAIEEYGDHYDPMGGGMSPRYPLTSISREQMGWPTKVVSLQNGKASILYPTKTADRNPTDVDIPVATGTYRVSVTPVLRQGKPTLIWGYSVRFLPKGGDRWGLVPAHEQFRVWLPGAALHDPAGNVTVLLGQVVQTTLGGAGTLTVLPAD